MAMAQSKADFFVETNGNDAWSGRSPAPNKAKTDGPFTTLARARDATRELKKGVPKRNIAALIRGNIDINPSLH